ncbi:retrovirus-related pol polyprotein from transposon TNT 1-94 [Tanacetum coccineum]
MVVDTTEAPPQAKRAKASKVLKKRTLPSTRQLVDEFVDEGVPDKEPMYGDEEADTQRAIEESLKEVPESSSLYAELGLTNSETDSDNEVSHDINPKAHIKGQAGSDPGKQVEAQAGSDPSVDADS